jgi:hypothetical protein
MQIGTLRKQTKWLNLALEILGYSSRDCVDMHICTVSVPEEERKGGRERERGGGFLIFPTNNLGSVLLVLPLEAWCLYILVLWHNTNLTNVQNCNDTWTVIHYTLSYGCSENDMLWDHIHGIKVKTQILPPVHTMKAYKGSRSVSPLILRLGSRCRIGQFHALATLPPSQSVASTCWIEGWLSSGQSVRYKERNLCFASASLQWKGCKLCWLLIKTLTDIEAIEVFKIAVTDIKPCKNCSYCPAMHWRGLGSIPG